jgi:hypothetical protein
MYTYQILPYTWQSSEDMRDCTIKKIYIERDGHMSRPYITATVRVRALHCVQTVDCVCQVTRHLLELLPINIGCTIRRRNIFDILFGKGRIRVTNNTRISISLPRRRGALREVKDTEAA